MSDFIFVTGNTDKVKMLEKFLGQEVKHHNLDLTEIQSLDSYEVTKQKALEAYRVLNQPVLVDDVSLSIAALGGLPGTFVKFFLKAVEGVGICKMVDAYKDRSATAGLIFVLYDGTNFHRFDAAMEGTISDKPRGDTTKLTKMGWNPIFIPEGQPKTIAEMSEDQLEKYTPRGLAAKKLKTFLEKEPKNVVDLS